MVKIFSSSIILILFAGVILLQWSCTQEADNEMTDAERIEHGRYLVTFGGCNDCHTPKIFTAEGFEFDSTKMLSGHPGNTLLPEIDTAQVKPGKWYLASSDLTAWVGPWGISYTANLTPDNPTGIGTWTEEVFISSLRTGKHMGVGRPILPPMPWMEISKLTNDDLIAIFSYLKSLPPIRNKVPDPVPPDQMATMR